ncbi:hypothetical protein OXYTRIMIC_535 [Oxytricha trifallax]|uniref:Uncharacterized protein n=1 Tax=Oxytricha trifallax TaxID=1172189 RepID=A0A073IAD0_9SPIT|nr:hypothetical protein OXYTRIMIC_535 [Oxytricha trifallax]
MGSYPHRQNASQNDVLGNPTSQTPQANYGAKIQSEITSNYLREYMLLKPQERYQFLETISLRNSQSLLEFLINLKTTCSSNFYDGMFGLIHELIVNSKVDLQIKTRLFVQSLLFYKNEIILIDQELLKNAMILLAQRPNSEQTLGLANYIFINEIEAFATLQEELVLLDRKNIGIIPLMGCTFTSFKIDPQVIRLLPNTLQCLNKPFIQILKQDHGLRLIRDIPINVVWDFLQISALGQAQSCTDLVKLISHISDIFVKKWDYLYQSDFSLLIAQFSVELKERNLRWISKLQEILEVIDQETFIQLEKGISNRPDVVFDLINANTNSLKAILKNPKIVEDLSGQQFFKMIDVFQYCCELQENQLIKSESLGKLEGLLGFQFLSLQKLCINYSLHDAKPYQFYNFGIGNGKTLLCATLAILLTNDNQKSTIIIGKNDYLVLRDEKRFSDVIIKSGLNINYNQFEDKLGVYYMTQKHFDSLTQDDNFLRQLESSIVILDEYDWLLFDGQPAYMFETINHLKRASKLIGLTGSILTQKEQTCLDSSFGVQEVKFPTLNSLKADKKTHHQDLLFNQQQSEFCKYLYELSMKQTLVTPLIIVASTSYVMIEHYFKKFKELQFFSMKGIKGSKADAYLEEKFNIQNTNKRYGVFLLSEIQGRGTDFHSSREIEDNGGIYLIIADIFSKKSTQQIVGRVGRLENKGQWRHVLWMRGSQDTVEKSIQFQQEFLDNESHIRFSKLQTLLSQSSGSLQTHNQMNLQDKAIVDGDLNQTDQENEVSAFDEKPQEPITKETTKQPSKVVNQEFVKLDDQKSDAQEAVNSVYHQTSGVDARVSMKALRKSDEDQSIGQKHLESKIQKSQSIFQQKENQPKNGCLKKRDAKQNSKNDKANCSQENVDKQEECEFKVPLKRPAKAQKVNFTLTESKPFPSTNLLNKRITRSKNVHIV